MTAAHFHVIGFAEGKIFPCLSRCVRHAYLCGQDVVTGRNFDHRRQWVTERILELAGLFAVEVYACSVMRDVEIG